MKRLRSKKRVYTIRFDEMIRERLESCARVNDVAVADVIRALVTCQSIALLEEQESCHVETSQQVHA